MSIQSCIHSLVAWSVPVNKDGLCSNPLADMTPTDWKKEWNNVKKKVSQMLINQKIYEVFTDDNSCKKKGKFFDDFIQLEKQKYEQSFLERPSSKIIGSEKDLVLES